MQTTIDPRLQATTVDALGGQSGGVAVLDARNGNVLALAGSAYSSPQPPGSTFKVITTTAALEGHEVKLSDTFPVVTEINPDPDAGARVIAQRPRRALRRHFVQAFAKSCNTVFAPLGVKVGAERLVDTAERYGLNQPPTLYNASGDRGHGPRPDDDPDRLRARRRPTHTDLSVTAFGQGKVLATPLGMASVAQTVANGGVRSPTPIVKDPELQSDAKPVEVTSKENARVLTGLMRAVVTSGHRRRGEHPGRPGRRQDRDRRARPQAGRSRRAPAGPGGHRPSRSSTPGSSPSPRPTSRSWRSP